MNVPANTKPWIQGAVVGAIAAAVVGFSWGGWVTGGSAAKQASAAAHDAKVTALASICADRFRAQGDAAVKIGERSKVSSWIGAASSNAAASPSCPAARPADLDVARACAESLASPPMPKT